MHPMKSVVGSFKYMAATPRMDPMTWHTQPMVNPSISPTLG